MTRRETLMLLAGLATGNHAATAAPLVTADRHHSEQALMGTRFAITCFHDDAATVQKASDAAFQAAAEINEVASDYIADSELLALSKHPVGTAVPLSPLLFLLLFQARHLAELTHGHFDPTLGQLTKLWREARRRKQLPDPGTLAKARETCGWKHLELDSKSQTARFTKPGMRLDLGGIAKGQAADAMLAVMQSHGIPSSCITAGGDVRAGDPPPESEGWKVAVRSSSEAAEIPTLSISNQAVSTSGDLHQSIEIGGVQYSHIIDPATGLGLTRPSAATVVAPCAALSDALATAACIAPPELSRADLRRWGATRLLLHHAQ